MLNPATWPIVKEWLADSEDPNSRALRAQAAEYIEFLEYHAMAGRMTREDLAAAAERWNRGDDVETRRRLGLL